MRRYVSSKPVATKPIAARPAASCPVALAAAADPVRPTPARHRLILATLLATTALNAAPITAFAADKIVDGVTETISTPQNFDNVTVGDTQPNSELDIVSGGTLGVSSIVTVGNQSGSVGTVTVSGAGAALNTDAISNIYIGRDGSGTLTVSDGGIVQGGRAVFGLSAGSSGTVTISGAGSTLTSTQFIGVGFNGTATLAITDGGEVLAGNNNVLLGYGAGSSGTVTVSGVGSQLTGSTVFVGLYGTGALSVSNGGTVQGNRIGIGYQAGGTGTVTVSGTGSTLTATTDIGVGVYGHGTLAISGGGAVSVGNFAAIGYRAGSSGTVTVSGTGSQLRATNQLSVGVYGSGTLTVSDGGLASSDNSIFVGANAGSSGTVTVSGTGAQLTAAIDIDVGADGRGTLIVSDGGLASASANVFIGDATGAVGTVTVSGAGSQLKAVGGINVGNSGTGTLIVSDGGVAEAGGDIIVAALAGSSGTLTISGAGAVHGSNNVVIGSDAGSSGTATVSGAGSMLTADHNIYVGREGSGTLTISGGGAVQSGSTANLFIADLAGSSGTVTVSGASSTLTANDIAVGNFGTGTLTISDGGVVSAGGNVMIGYVAGSSGTVTISGAGSTLTSAGDISVGNNGTGSLTISDGGAVSARRLIVANNTDSQGTVTISGRGSTLKVSSGSLGNLYIGDGYRSTGTLTISNGATVEAGGLSIATSARSQGELVVTGAGSKLTLSGNSFIGDGGLDSTGTVTITDGGEIVSNALVAIGAIGVSTLTVSGSGSKLTTTGNIDVGRSISTGTLTVSNRGVVESAGLITLASDAGSSGTLNIGAAAGAASAAAGRVQGAGGTAANIAFGAGTGAIVFNHTDLNYVFDANVSGNGALSQLAGVTSLTGDFTGFAGPTNVSGGTLSVDTVLGGPVHLLAGGTVGGTGTISDLIISAGGTLAPGSVANPYGTLTITDPLTFAAGSFYSVRLSAGINSFTQVNSTADLGGATVNAVFGTAGSVSLQPYKIFTASGGFTGTFDPLVGSNLANFKPTLSYDANDVYLKLSFAFPTGLNGNQQAVANALTSAFNATGIVPLAFGALDAKGLSQAAGETATGSQQTTFDAMNRFMTMMADPDAGNRGAEVGPGTGSAPRAYAGTTKPADAMAAITRAAYAKAPTAAVFVPSWRVWAAGFGGNETTDGNVAAGTSGMTSSIYGVAAGADYRFAPDWTAGFALAGGGSNFKVTGSGDGRSDLFQVGGFLRHTMGPAYISAALAYGVQDVTTTRTVTLAGLDRLQAKFDTNTVSGRIEGGWRFFAPVLGGVGITPYAAAQVTTTLLPGYAETVLSGGNTFALTYGSKTITDPLSELGVRADKSYALVDGAVLTLRGRAAWGHDFNPNRTVSATFQGLPLSSFVVNGAAQAGDAALTSVSAEVAWVGGWSAGLTFDGAFSDVTRSYAGKAVVHRAW